MLKAGWKTTEFWITVVGNLIIVAGSIEGILPAQTAAVVLAVLNGIYTVLRTLAKQPEITTLSHK